MRLPAKSLAVFSKLKASSINFTEIFFTTLQRIHLNIRNFKCTDPSCLKDFVHQTSLKNHLLTHSKVRSFVCSHCGLAFTTNGNLTQHKAKHDEASRKKFVCDICDKRFNRRSNLKEHFASHTKEQLYKCEQCHKKFSTSSSLAKHKKIHMGLKPFKCPIPSCRKSFSQNSHLKKHLHGSIHSAANSCNICLRSFRRSDTLQKHLQTHKKIYVPKTTIISNEIIVPSGSTFVEIKKIL